MKYTIGLLALVALQVCTTNGQRACVCARNYAPVCGTDGVTYSNECRLECEAYLRNTGLSVASEGPCTTGGVQIAETCFCTDDLNEVCGSDGKTYTNNCSLSCAISKDNTLNLEHLGKCKTIQVLDLQMPPCPCLNWDFDPICGSNGQTYANPCFFKCATKNNNTLSIEHHGSCQAVHVVDLPVQPPCLCLSREYDPVCGSNGQTYANPCFLNCATVNDNTLSIKHHGSCQAVHVVDLPVQPPCLCLSREYDPVCGSNGQTYANPCFLNCATVNDNTLSIKHHGSCQAVHVVDLPVQPPCLCLSREYDPVCGSNGQTYANPCFLNCATVNDNTLSIKHHGACEMVQVASTPAPCTCTRNMSPVCGSDGKTYNNECLLNCASESNQTLSISHHGQCGAVYIVD